MKFLIFGTGEYYSRYKKWFAKKEIVALIDNSKEKQGQCIDDIVVIPPEAVPQYEFDAIIILSFYVKTMKSQLIELGVEERRIFHFFDLHGLIYSPERKKEIHYYGFGHKDLENIREGACRKVLLLGHDLTLGGPAFALYHAAQVLVKNGYQVVYGSMLDGPLRGILIEEGIPVVVDENLMIETMNEAEWVNEYSIIICNTMNFHVFLSERDEKIPVVWWLHDALFFYDGVRREVMDKLSEDNMQIWSVGPVPEKAVKTFRSDFHVKQLLYGVADQIDGRDKRNRQHPKVRFITIGYIEYRKGQDILLEAIKSLKSDIRQEAEFFFVGQNTSLLAKKLIKTAGTIPEITVIGPVNRKEINILLEQSDILVCPSREDPMPMVAAEAMMHSLPCLISDNAGTVKYIRDGIDGMVFQSENIDQLKEMLESCIQGRVNLKQMSRNARKVFEKYFSMGVFEHQFKSLIEGI